MQYFGSGALVKGLHQLTFFTIHRHKRRKLYTVKGWYGIFRVTAKFKIVILSQLVFICKLFYFRYRVVAYPNKKRVFNLVNVIINFLGAKLAMAAIPRKIEPGYF